jgi:hypothetical protein
MDQPKTGERFMPGDPAAAAGRRGGSSAAPPGLPDGLPDGEAIRAAAVRIAGIAHRTPVVTSRSLDEMAGARLYFKC